jgi:hypothetical protein
MTKPQSYTDARYRSLLQKAVRRGNTELVYTTSALLENLGSREKNWFRTRAAIITFEECWPLGAELMFNRQFHSKVAALIKVTECAKARDATGLGYLAYALFEGDRSMLDGSAEDRAIKIIASALQRPDDFWGWIDKQDVPEKARALANHAGRFRHEGLPRDKSVMQSAAYLAATGNIPVTKIAQLPDARFPFWTAFDHHTPEGKRALRDVARDLHIPLPQLEWVLFYFEGSMTNGELPSTWWQKLCRWHFKKIGIPVEEAHLIWEPVKSQLLDALAEESRQLQGSLYRWKLAHLDRIDSLKKQVHLFIEKFDALQPDQLELF